MAPLLSCNLPVTMLALPRWRLLLLRLLGGLVAPAPLPQTTSISLHPAAKRFWVVCDSLKQHYIAWQKGRHCRPFFMGAGRVHLHELLGAEALCRRICWIPASMFCILVLEPKVTSERR